MKENKIAAAFYKGYCRTITWEGRKRVGMVTMTKKGHQLLQMMTKKSSVFFVGKNRVTPLVTAPGDTDPSDATELNYVAIA